MSWNKKNNRRWIKISDNSESDKKAPTILENIELYITSIAGEKTLLELAEIKGKLNSIKDIIETSYSIGDYVERYELYQQQQKSTTVLQGITNMMMPEFKEFIAAKFKQAQEVVKDQEEPVTKEE